MVGLHLRTDYTPLVTCFIEETNLTLKKLYYHVVEAPIFDKFFRHGHTSSKCHDNVLIL